MNRPGPRPAADLPDSMPQLLSASTLRVCLFLAGLILGLPVMPATAETDREAAAAELEAVRERIEALEQAIEAARDESSTLENKLRELESDIQNGSRQLESLQEDIAAKSRRLEQLTEQRRTHEDRLADVREALAEQMRAAYKAGRRDYLKLLLNQQDPALMGRMLSYYDYYNRARSRQIHALSDQLEQLAEVTRRIEREQAALARLEQSEQARLEELRGLRDARRQVISHLNEQIRDDRRQLADLREDQQRLEQLLEDLRTRPPAKATVELPAFGELQGKLDWPVSGRILNSFGSSRRGSGDMVWQGVRIAAGQGDRIRAVSAGQVIFADWFRTLGLLLIIDHGDGYMTLYGHNQELLKSQGAWVEDGETVALAGDSGGQERSALYFEIRHDGKPVDPARWCQR